MIDHCLTRAPSGRTRLLGALVAAATAGLLLYVAVVLGGLPVPPPVLFEGTLVAAAAACLVRGLGLGRRDATSALTGAALACWVAGDVYWTLRTSADGVPPAPGLADAGYLAFYPLMAAAIIVPLRSAERRLRSLVALDVVSGAMIAASLSAVALYPALVGAAHGSPSAMATNLAYPIGDLVLIVLTVVRITLLGSGWRPAWTLRLAGLASFIVADAFYLDATARGIYVSGRIPDALWLAGGVFLAAGAVTRDDPQPVAPAQTRWLPAAPAVFGLGATVLLIWDHFAATNRLSLSLAGLSLTVLALRTALTLWDNARLLAARERDMLHDPLTGLPNRRAFRMALDRELALVARRESRFGVLMIDIDNFKYVNDTLGHAAGDRLIGAVGSTIQAEVRAGDLLARLGGDEFAIMLVDAGRDETADCAERIGAALRKAYLVPEAPRGQVTVSIGAALVDASNPMTAEDALSRADAAMYAAKESGRDGWVMHEDGASTQALIAERFSWSSRIRHALQDDGFVLYAQPVFDAHDRQIWGYELLLRLRRPGGGLWLPGAFLGEAERFGLMTAIDRWVIERAVRLAASAPRPVFVNLSPMSVADEETRSFVEHTVRAAELPVGRLMFEITEHAAVADLPAAHAFATELKRLGCRLALDDFGAGFASFFHLKHLPFDCIKIDGSFIRSIAHDPTDQAVVEAIVAVARRLGKCTVAEQVPDAQSLAVLRDMGVDKAQSFFLGEPGPVHEVFGRGDVGRPGRSLAPAAA